VLYPNPLPSTKNHYAITLSPPSSGSGKHARTGHAQVPASAPIITAKILFMCSHEMHAAHRGIQQMAKAVGLLVHPSEVLEHAPDVRIVHCFLQRQTSTFHGATQKSSIQLTVLTYSSSHFVVKLGLSGPPGCKPKLSVTTLTISFCNDKSRIASQYCYPMRTTNTHKNELSANFFYPRCACLIIHENRGGPGA
jgi:hypothetical protein